MSLLVISGEPLPLADSATFTTMDATPRARSLTGKGYRHPSQTVLSWCWAACIEGADSLSGPPARTTAEIVYQQLGCSDPDSCTAPLNFSSLQETWKEFDYPDVEPLKRSLDFDEIQSQIASGMPVEALLAGEAHYVLLVGWSTQISGSPLVEVSDPLEPGPTFESLDQLKNAPDLLWNKSVRQIERR